MAHKQDEVNGRRIRTLHGAGTHTLSRAKAQKALRRRVVVRMITAGENGRIVGLLGPNGAGKTTTFYMVVSLAIVWLTIYLDGKDDTHYHDLSPRMGLCLRRQSVSSHSQ